MKCINCNNKKLEKIVNLDRQVISSLFYNQSKRNLKSYPLDLYECKRCNIVQLKKLAPLKNMYGSTYGYRTSLSPLMINHMKEKFQMILNKKIISKKGQNILDIGCNDGTFLNFFSKKNYKCLYGIDPSAGKFTSYHSKYIKLEVDFFSRIKIEKRFGNKKFKLITSFAMFYDILDPNSFCNDIYLVLF
jgi:NDP-4-keto-2,6-dideoxyhexose 3-C-methyltransferase